MNFTVDTKFRGKKLALTIDVKDTAVGEGSLLGFIVQAHNQTCETIKFEDWFKRICAVQIINAASCMETTKSVDAFYAFLKGYYAAKENYHWYGGISK